MFKLFKDYILGIDQFIANDIQYKEQRSQFRISVFPRI